MVLTGVRLGEGVSQRETDGSGTQSRGSACSPPRLCFLFPGRGPGRSGGAISGAAAAGGLYSLAIKGVFAFCKAQALEHNRASWQIPALAVASLHQRPPRCVALRPAASRLFGEPGAVVIAEMRATLAAGGCCLMKGPANLARTAAHWWSRRQGRIGSGFGKALPCARQALARAWRSLRPMFDSGDWTDARHILYSVHHTQDTVHSAQQTQACTSPPLTHFTACTHAPTHTARMLHDIGPRWHAGTPHSQHYREDRCGAASPRPRAWPAARRRK